MIKLIGLLCASASARLLDIAMQIQLGSAFYSPELLKACSKPSDELHVQ